MKAVEDPNAFISKFENFYYDFRILDWQGRGFALNTATQNHSTVPQITYDIKHKYVFNIHSGGVSIY